MNRPQQRRAVFGLLTFGVVITLVAGLVSTAAVAAEPLLVHPPGMVSYTYREPFKTEGRATLQTLLDGERVRALERKRADLIETIRRH